MIQYIVSPVGIHTDQLTGFFVGWPNPPSLQTHLQLLQNSHSVILAMDMETGKVIGFITAISDGILSAYIPFLEVLPEYQGQGIGSELVNRMLAKLKDLYMIDLLCDDDLLVFYERFGMKPALGMMLRNYDRQNAKGK
jgi:ribosomal protein S18 acetylase RimI-like enzyme